MRQSSSQSAGGLAPSRDAVEDDVLRLEVRDESLAPAFPPYSGLLEATERHVEVAPEGVVADRPGPVLVPTWRPCPINFTD